MARYVCSDFHGFYSLYEQIHKFIKPEDTVYYLGDATDRGPHGWKLLKAILDDPQWIYIYGNHDDLIVTENRTLHIWNGGAPTLQDMEKDSPEEVSRIRRRLAAAPYCAFLISDSGEHIFLSHSGDTIFDPEKLIWGREHFLDPLPEGIDIVIFGHTPVYYLSDYVLELTMTDHPVGGKSATFAVPGGYRIDVDCGTIFTGSCVLLDIDTFQQHPFYVDDSEVEYVEYL